MEEKHDEKDKDREKKMAILMVRNDETNYQEGRNEAEEGRRRT